MTRTQKHSQTATDTARRLRDPGLAPTLENMSPEGLRRLGGAVEQHAVDNRASQNLKAAYKSRAAKEQQKRQAAEQQLLQQAASTTHNMKDARGALTAATRNTAVQLVTKANVPAVHSFATQSIVLKSQAKLEVTGEVSGK